MAHRGLLLGLTALVVAIPTSANAVVAVKAHPSPTANGTLSPDAKRALHQGYLVPNQRAYEKQKRQAAKAAPANPLSLTAPFTGPRRLAPSVNRSWSGQTSAGFAPSDSTGAVGNSNFIQLVNSRFAIYNKSDSTPISSGTLNTLANASTSDTLYDVQVIWDPTTKRFYYVMIDAAGAASNNLAFGWSRTSSPTSGSSADWCQYSIAFGTRFPDYPKLGDSKPFAIIGVNVFVGSAFTGPEVLAFHKPGSGTSCPSGPTIHSKTGLKTNNSTLAFTPVPANEIDNQGTGWVVARPSPTPSSKLAVFKVTKNDNGNPQIQGTSNNISVSSYDEPPPAKQEGSSSTIDTLDARMTQAIGAIDPNHNNKFAVWTQHTVKGGGGSKVSWYEIDPKTPKILQKGNVSNSSFYDFNGAISPNRAVSGSSASGGSNMLMNFNSSSKSSFPAARIVSKKGSDSTSGQVVVAKSPGPLGGFDCNDSGGPGKEAEAADCRWGDYASATPDPKDKSKIWNVTQLASGNQPTCPGIACVATWVTRLFVASP